MKRTPERTIESSSTSTYATANVYLEGLYGDVVAGAVVLVTLSDNAVAKLDFDPSSYCYRTKTLPLYLDQVDYRFSVQSNANQGKTVSYAIPHRFLSQAPVVTQLEDSSGNSVLLGNALDTTKIMQIAWSASADNCCYQVAVKDSVQTVFATSTVGTSIQIPADTIPGGGSYYLEIVAQSLLGDPTFQECDYTSVSSCPSAKVLFNVT